MAITPSCDFCNNELTELGGLLFSPPTADSTVVKQHLCVSCYAKVQELNA